MLPFHAEIVRALVEGHGETHGSSSSTSTSTSGVGDSALLVLGRGLGMDVVVEALLRVHAHARQLVLLVNASTEEVAYYRERLEARALCGSVLRDEPCAPAGGLDDNVSARVNDNVSEGGTHPLLASLTAETTQRER